MGYSATVTPTAFSSAPCLQDVSLGQTMSFNIMAVEFLQILHTSQGNWLTISNIVGYHSTKIKVYVPCKNANCQLVKDDIIELHITEVDTMLYCALTSVLLLTSYFTVGHLWLRSVFHCVRYSWRDDWRHSQVPFGTWELVFQGPSSPNAGMILVYCHCRMSELKRKAMIECNDWVHQVQQMVSRWLWSSAKGHSGKFRSCD